VTSTLNSSCIGDPKQSLVLTMEASSSSFYLNPQEGETLGGVLQRPSRSATSRGKWGQTTSGIHNMVPQRHRISHKHPGTSKHPVIQVPRPFRLADLPMPQVQYIQPLPHLDQEGSPQGSAAPKPVLHTSLTGDSIYHPHHNCKGVQSPMTSTESGHTSSQGGNSDHPPI
jgi:hypothetical protein